MNSNLLPGFGIIQESGTDQNLFPGYGIVMESVAAAAANTGRSYGFVIG